MELKIKCDQQMKTTCKYNKYKEKTGSNLVMQTTKDAKLLYFCGQGYFCNFQIC